MKFIIKRASDYASQEKPIERAEVLREYNKERYEYGVYGIEINSLEELLSIKKECGHSIIIEDSWEDKEDFPEYGSIIIIYDDYVE